MSVAIASRVRGVRPDDRQGKQSLAVVPILGSSAAQPAYETLRQDTFASVQVTEISEGGSVPELKVHNALGVRVFLMDGQELVGAKQNRILNTDVLVGAGQSITIPVSCVEQGRWSRQSVQFHPGKAAPHRTRSGKLGRVHASLKEKGRHDAGQGAVWAEVSEALAKTGVSSDTSALSAAYEKRDRDLAEFRRELTLPKKAVGVAVFQRGEFLGLDLFDRHSTLEGFWEALVDSYSLELLDGAVEAGQAAKTDEARCVREVLAHVSEGSWERFGSPGEGADWRLEDRRYAASSLVWDEQVVIHLQVFPRAMSASGGEAALNQPVYRPRIRRRYGA